MHPTTLVIGGCRSGKSRHALEMAHAAPARRKLFVATCEPADGEMDERVRRHQQERGPSWHTVEAPLELAAAILQAATAHDVAVVDCLTLWLSNLLLAHPKDPAAIDSRVEALCDVLAAPPCPLLLVTNEVGSGIVPENALARRYRDLVGQTNQRVAAACRQVVWMVAGIAVPIKTAPLG
ncbi:bifunctional adenosylcobinamide kinase/adenosylcobinamide-phosphate guanylyltransferase [Desulfatitalea alkaliphila]|uniref:Adenosylcobinamide kinase n=1 Tax=Desulfatitalea alkaliphila TaxID=2929485 RepID=A0AA41R8B2_9BACT|nr:bifunctional adenosylcobinamide kinase/adenosylcobinamide-phosphate guanylyltransferase [Desulfatitalea alkaliphila]MCJ8500768.1 bifunctional adenosylcobinamide kinase/adenosylcobinamide-phosphate guanylyltransferase [Desulfatitalea alkaliphila]